MDQGVSSAFGYASDNPGAAMDAVVTAGDQIYNLAKDSANAYTVSRTASRIVTGAVLTPLGPLAVIGDVTEGIENGRTSYIDHARSVFYGSE